MHVLKMEERKTMLFLHTTCENEEQGPNCRVY